MDLSVVSYNVRGLNSRRFKTRLKIILCELNCYMVFLQEHKLHVINEQGLATQIWKPERQVLHDPD